MSLVLRVSTSSFEFPFWTHNLFMGFQIIAEIINRGHLYVPPSVYLWCFWALLHISSFSKVGYDCGLRGPLIACNWGSTLTALGMTWWLDPFRSFLQEGKVLFTAYWTSLAAYALLTLSRLSKAQGLTTRLLCGWLAGTTFTGKNSSNRWSHVSAAFHVSILFMKVRSSEVCWLQGVSVVAAVRSKWQHLVGVWFQ